MTLVAPRKTALSRTACFSVHADADPNLLNRLLEPFAKRGLTLSRVHADTEADNRLTVDIQVAGMDLDLAGQIGAGLRQVIGVETVLVSEKARA